MGKNQPERSVPSPIAAYFPFFLSERRAVGLSLRGAHFAEVFNQAVVCVCGLWGKVEGGERRLKTDIDELF